MEIYIYKMPVMREALEMYKKGVRTGVNAYNRELVKDYMQFKNDVPAWHKEIFFDPQTSGGLLAAVPQEQGDNLVSKLRDAGIEQAVIIGVVKELDGSNYLVFS